MLKRLAVFLLCVFAGCSFSGGAYAQTGALVVATCGTLPLAYKPGATRPLTQDITGKQCSSASASISGFQTTTYGTPISATTGGATGSIPTNAGEFVAQNVGTTYGVFCKTGGSVDTGGQYLSPNGGWWAYAITSETQITCEGVGGTTTVNLYGGTGLPTGTGGGGGTGSSGAVYGPTARGSAAANPPVLVGGTADGGATSNVGVWKVDSSGTGYIDAVSAGNLLSAIANPINGLSGSAQSTSNPLGYVTGTGTAGTAAINPFTVQGIASMVPLLTNPGTIATWGLMSGTTPGTAPTNTLIAGGIYNSTAPTLTTGQTAPLQVGPRGGLLIGGGGYPIGSTPITISGTGTTGATTATLATGASVTTYICGFSIRANATAAATGNATITGTITGTLNFTQWTAPNASGLGVTEMIFTPCVPASAVNTGIAVISAAPGTGGVVSVTAWGFTL